MYQNQIKLYWIEYVTIEYFPRKIKAHTFTRSNLHNVENMPLAQLNIITRHFWISLANNNLKPTPYQVNSTRL